MRPYSACYGGHQFGHWAGQLGDGRAITLAEGVGTDGARWELQLKGAGPTPYSRTADGRAVLRSSLREFLCSEAMHALGVPTTRALALVATGEAVVRDILYRGDPQPEPGAITSRVAPSFLRFGSYELPTARGDHALLEQLVAFTIARDFPHLAAAHPGDAAAQRAAWFAEVCTRTAGLMAHWMRVGFVHGVMNTDNLSVLGLTIDYGPYGWVEAFDPHFTPNTTDAGQRRYRFGQQPAVAQWHLVRLAEALVPLFPDDEPLAAVLGAFDARFQAEHQRMSAAKVGLADVARPARRRAARVAGAVGGAGGGARRAHGAHGRGAPRGDARGEPPLHPPQLPGAGGDPGRGAGRPDAAAHVAGGAGAAVRRPAGARAPGGAAPGVGRPRAGLCDALVQFLI